MLWANDQEMAQVRSLLVKLGELPPPGGSPQRVRMMDAAATPETLQYLQRLKRQWSRLSPHSIVLPDARHFTDPNERESGKDNEKELPKEKEESDKPPQNQRVDPTVATIDEAQREFLTAVQSSDDEKASPTPIQIELDANGNLVMTCADTEALDQLEHLMLQMKPPRRPYQVIHIEHASAHWMRLNLEDYFRDADADDDSDSNNFFRWYWGDGGDDDDEKPQGLGKGNAMRFVDDLDTNTLVITGATPEQLKTIEELIELWDVPEPVNKRKTRFTRLVTVNYGKANKIAETVKEAYRDLLSSNDKAFLKNAGRGDRHNGGLGSVGKNRHGKGSSLKESESDHDGGGADFSFKGKLSIGIDTIGNSLLVSAEGEPLLDLITSIITKLDEAARPQGEVQILKLSGGMNGRSLKKALEAIGGHMSGDPKKPSHAGSASPSSKSP